MNFKELRRIGREIEVAAEEKRPPEVLADEAILKMLGDDLDRAVEGLERSVKRAPGSPGVLNDLAAAYLARAQQQDQPRDLLLALSTAEQAVHLESPPRGACFNRALALERLFLEAEARPAWRQCLAAERMPAWRSAIQVHLEKLGRPPEGAVWPIQEKLLDRAATQQNFEAVVKIVDRFAQPARESIEEKIMPEWAEAELSGRSQDADRALSIARSVGHTLEDRGDFMVQDFVRAAEALRSRPRDRAKLLKLAAGHLSYAKGLTAWKQRLFTEAASAFGHARADLERAGSPFASWALFQSARCAYERADYGKATAIVSSLNGRRNRDRYPVLVARSLWLQGLMLLIRGNPAEALVPLTSALSIFEKLNETPNLTEVHTLLSVAYESLGDSAAAWRHRWRALAAAHRQNDPRLLYLAQEEGAVAALSMSYPRIALYFQNELVSTASSSSDAIALVGGLRGRATIHLRLGAHEKAEADLNAARGALPRIPDPTARQILEGDLFLVSGESKLRSDPRTSVGDLGQALRIYRETSYDYLFSQILVDRARAYRALGLDERAEADFAAAIQEWERGRRAVASDPLRSAFFDKSRSLFSEMIGFQLDRRGHADLAFDYVEHAKSRVLLDWISDLGNPSRVDQPLGNEGAPLRSREVSANLPPDKVLVQYWVLDDRLQVWIVGRETFKSVSVQIGSEALLNMARDYIDAVRLNKQSRLAPAVRRASTFLWAPIERWIPESSEVVFIPDLMLQEVPFAALVGQDGKYLVASHAVSVAPSATIFIKSLSEAGKRSGGTGGDLLLVGNPSFDRQKFPELASLPAANHEVEAIRRGFPRVELQLGADATKANFLKAVGKYRTVHFAGHSVLNSEEPLRSCLVLAPDPGTKDSGALYARELLGRHFGSTSLVVLSACSTARGRMYGLEGASGIARAFLATGVPSVVASLWDVEDAVASRFFLKFYTWRVSKGRVVDALRAAQLDLIALGEPPSDWAAFELTGGS